MFEIIPFDHRRSSVSSYNPFRDFDEMERAFFGNSVGQFRTDVLENSDSFIIEAELPGFKKEDISLDIDSDCLSIKAEHKEDSSDEKKNYIRRERFYGSYSRSFDVSGVDTESIKAEYQDGILKLTLPKKAPEKPKTIHIDLD